MKWLTPVATALTFADRINEVCRLAAFVLMTVVQSVALLGALAASTGLMVQAGFELAHGIASVGAPSGDHKPLKAAISGIEYLFLAPLPVLVVWGLLRYIQENAPTKNGKADLARLSAVRAEVVYLKTFTAGLLVAICGAWTVGEVLAGTATVERIAGPALAMSILGGYALLLERHGDPREAKPNTREPLA